MTSPTICVSIPEGCDVRLSHYYEINLYGKDSFGNPAEQRLMVSHPVSLEKSMPVTTSSNVVLPPCPFCKGQAGFRNDDEIRSIPHVVRRLVGCFGFHGECDVQPKAQGSSDEAAIAAWKRLCAAIEDRRPVPAGTVQALWFDYIADAEKLLTRPPGEAELSALRRRFTEGFSVYFAIDEIHGSGRA